MWWKVLLSIGLTILLVNLGFSLYNLVIQIQTKDTVHDSWGWILLRVLAVLGSLNVLRTLWVKMDYK